MTWCSEVSTSPGLRLASSAIHRRFVDRFAELMSLPVFPVDGSLLATPPFPRSGPGEPGSPLSAVLRRRYDFPCAHQRSLICFASAAHGYLLLRVRRSAPASSEEILQARALVPAARRSGSSYVDAHGTSQVFRRSFPRLCSVPRPRSSQRVLASTGYIDAAPATHTAKASAIPDFGADLQLQHSLTVRFRRGVAAAPARLASGWRAAPLPGGLRTLWIATKGFSSLV